MRENARKGILAGGNWIMDQVKVIDRYPPEERLANILRQHAGTGGAPFNVLAALYNLGADFPLEGIGAIGDDDKGAEILRRCEQMGIKTNQITALKNTHTSYSDVMSDSSSGRRTFFHYRGANRLLDTSHFDFSQTGAKLFHLGYLLLLDRLDEVTEDGLTKATTVFKEAKEAGCITSADIVSEQSGRYKRIISSSLPFIDILFLNEYEAEMLTDIEMISNKKVSLEKAYKAAAMILNKGVSEWVIIHFPEGAVARSKQGKRMFQPAINLPPDRIKGTVGAGDALAAGVLYGLHQDWILKKSLKLGVSVAAASLTDETASEGVIGWQECMKLKNKFGFKK
jgi:sugar/nucleoside kinase (ribokinase family)